MMATIQRDCRGQSTVEWALTFAGIILPLTSMIIFGSQMVWSWHSVVEFTRDGARYASTHCWDGSGQNVVNYMRSRVPVNVDIDQFTGGQAEIQVQYFQRNPDTNELEDFVCEAATCSIECVPQAVTVRVLNYEFRRFFAYLGLPPVPAPDFHTSVAMESAGCDPDTGTCVP
jgi:hypothetical protein